MTPDDTLERQLVESMASVAASGPPDYLDDILGRSSRTRQRRAWPLQRSVFSTRAPHGRAGWRTGRSYMTPILRIAAVAALALAIGVVIDPFGPSTRHGVSDPTPSASPGPSPAPLRNGPLPAGTYVTTPFANPGSDACFVPPQASCIDATDDDETRITFTVPDGWSGDGSEAVAVTSESVGRAALLFLRGASLAADPCHDDGTGDIPVGPSVDDFVSALRDHPLLSVTDPVDITLDGYPGTYLELQVPDDPTIQGSSQPGDLEGCPVYRPWDPWYLAQGPGELWHLWIVDVDGVRVVVQAVDTAGTSADVKAQFQGIVDSIRIDLPVPPAVSPLPAQSVVQGWPGTGANPAGVYSWRPGGQLRSWMHNYHESGDVEITFGTWDEAGEARRSLVAAAGFDQGTHSDGPVRVPDDRPVGTSETHTGLWLLDVHGTRVFMLIEATPGTPAAAVAEAEAIVESVEVGPPSLGPGIVLTFEMPDGWDSGQG